ncbi:MAG: gamma-glutamyltransferase [Woeseiaceae bacterium]
MSQVAVATTSQLAADAAEELARKGGNAVDCALAASLVTMNTEPGVCALAGGAYVTIWKAGADPVTIDGNVAIPGFGVDPARRGDGVDSVTMQYGGGVTTTVGCGAVGAPGSLAAVQLAWQKFGSASWADIFAPAIRTCRDGFPLSSACHYYLGYSGDCIFGRSADGHGALHDDGVLRDAGSPVVVPHLADSLEVIAEEGARAFYEGDLAQAIASHVQNAGGLLSAEDLARYRALERPALRTDIDEWTIASNPPPAVGGAVLAAMLSAFSAERFDGWNEEAVARLITVQQACLNYRKRHLDLADDVGDAAAGFLAAAQSGQLLDRWLSASTVHTSAVDDQGTGCAITASSGYGSGEMPAGTGLWLNNCLGELELNRRGLHAEPVGARLPSNMAPSVACRRGRVLAVGSPGADRITTALHQFLVNALQLGMSLEDAAAHPRVHLDTSGERDRLLHEAGLPMPETDLHVQTYDDLVMYFGGVGAASYDREHGFEVAADPRREGGICIFRE